MKILSARVIRKFGTDSYRFYTIEYPNLNDYQAQLERNTRDLKDLAKELNVPVLITAPISKSLEFRENKRPIIRHKRLWRCP